MATVRLILVGGFLGAGKTTLLARAAQLLAAQGRRVGLITNDQAPNLADTRLLEQYGFKVGEVSGGCFCCNFDAFVAAVDNLKEETLPEIIISEPVGSCTDISATVFQPLKKYHSRQFSLAPFTVLADPYRLREFLKGQVPGGFSDDVIYIYRKQLEEADLIVLNKEDLLSPREIGELATEVERAFPGKTLLKMAAQSGRGVEEWLDYLAREPAAGGQITQMDYEVYAEGEAALGWLNAEVDLQAVPGPAWRDFISGFMGAMQKKFKEARAEVAHLKLNLTTSEGYLQANLTSSAGDFTIIEGGKIEQANEEHASMVVNARCHLDPQCLRTIVEQSLAKAAAGNISARIKTLESFKPSPPQPTHRFDEVV